MEIRPTIQNDVGRVSIPAAQAPAPVVTESLERALLWHLIRDRMPFRVLVERSPNNAYLKDETW